jgi:hypothetical protein
VIPRVLELVLMVAGGLWIGAVCLCGLVLLLLIAADAVRPRRARRGMLL